MKNEFVLILLLSFALSAQTMNVWLKSGSIEPYEIKQIRKITYVGSGTNYTMVLTKRDTTTVGWAVNDIRKITFANVSGVKPDKREIRRIMGYLGSAVYHPAAKMMDLRFALTRRSAVVAQVYDGSGKIVATVFRGSLEAGNQLLTWNRKMDSGRLAGPGVYVVRVIIDGVAGASKFIVAQ